MRLTLLLPFVFAAALSAERIVDFSDVVALHDHETVQYRIPIAYGAAPSVSIHITVRSFDAAPRARLLNPDFGEAKDAHDTNHDGVVDFTLSTATMPHYFLEVDAANPLSAGEFEIRVNIDAPDGAGSSADVFFSKYFFDHDNDISDERCTTGEGTTWLWALAALAMGAWLWRRIDAWRRSANLAPTRP